MADALADVYVKLDGMTGECTDESHPGKDGWIQIKKFNFGFGMPEGSWDGGGTGSAGSAGSGGNGGSSGGAGANNFPLDFPDASLTKDSDLSSTRLLKEKCHEGAPIKRLELVACRQGGKDEANPKIPFLTIIFTNVYIKSISLSVSQDELPSETIKFKYDIVQMKTIWTDNETGDRLVADPNRCGWDRENNKEYVSQD